VPDTEVQLQFLHMSVAQKSSQASRRCITFVHGHSGHLICTSIMDSTFQLTPIHAKHLGIQRVKINDSTIRDSSQHRTKTNQEEDLGQQPFCQRPIKFLLWHYLSNTCMDTLRAFKKKS
jgi:hypothetical protein